MKGSAGMEGVEAEVGGGKGVCVCVRTRAAV